MPDAKTVDLTYAGWMGARFSSQGPEGPPGEPRAEQHVLARTFHGVSLNDEFDWLKAANWREVMRDPLKLDSAIRAYLQAEKDYCERALGETAGLQQTLFAEMKARIKEDDSPTMFAIVRRDSIPCCAGSREDLRSPPLGSRWSRK